MPVPHLNSLDIMKLEKKTVETNGNVNCHTGWHRYISCKPHKYPMMSAAEDDQSFIQGDLTMSMTTSNNYYLLRLVNIIIDICNDLSRHQQRMFLYFFGETCVFKWNGYGLIILTSTYQSIGKECCLTSARPYFENKAE